MKSPIRIFERGFATWDKYRLIKMEYQAEVTITTVFIYFKQLWHTIRFYESRTGFMFCRSQWKILTSLIKCIFSPYNISSTLIKTELSYEELKSNLGFSINHRIPVK